MYPFYLLSVCFFFRFDFFFWFFVALCWSSFLLTKGDNLLAFFTTAKWRYFNGAEKVAVGRKGKVKASAFDPHFILCRFDFSFSFPLLFSLGFFLFFCSVVVRLH